jgi:hypothetical protein
LMPGLAARNLRKIPNPPFRVAKPGELFHHRRYRFRYRFRKGPLACIMSSADNNRMTEKSFYAGCGALPSRSAGVFQSPLVATLQEELDIDGLPRVELASGGPGDSTQARATQLRYACARQSIPGSKWPHCPPALRTPRPTKGGSSTSAYPAR